MNRASRFLFIAALFAAAALFGPASVCAQYRYNPYLQWQQALYVQQMAAMQQAQLANQAYYGGFPNAGYYSAAGANPYIPAAAAASYVPAAPGVTANPYSPVDPSLGNPYSPYNPYNPYNNYGYGAGSVLFGQADVMRAYGQTINTIEQARVTRELAIQARLDTIKKEHELRLYIKATTPTYTQEQERYAKITLRRIQTNSLPGEVANGKSLNYLLDDLRKFPNKKVSLEPITLSDDVLFHLNVTKRTYGMGLLRDNGKVTWPAALQNADERQALDRQLQQLAKEAYNNRIDANMLKDVRNRVGQIRDDLVKRVNEVPTSQYLEAKRFLQELEEASTAIEQGEAQNQLKFQSFIDKGKGNVSIQDLTDFMVREGLRFGPATARDESAYRAVHAGMATLDIAMNTQFGDYKE